MPNTKNNNHEGRHLVLVDPENIAATPSPTSEDVEMVNTTLRECVPGYDDAQRIVACSHHAAATVSFGFPGARHLWQSGRDGADLALLAVLEHERVHERFDRVTICSGDGIFAESAAMLGSAGVEVTVVSLEGRLATRLELAASEVVLLVPATDPMSTRSAG